MGEQEKEKQGPSHRVSFARLNGRDENGKEVLGPAREIGSVWPRKGKEGEGILRFDHIPEELRARGGGVLFVTALETGADSRAKAPQSNTPRKERDFDRDR